MEVGERKRNEERARVIFTRILTKVSTSSTVIFHFLFYISVIWIFFITILRIRKATYFEKEKALSLQ